MNALKKRQAEWPLWVALGLYVIAGALLLGRFTSHVTPDGLGYLGVAQQYVDGNWGDAVNGYWGPLLSWLLAPLLSFGVDGLLALKLVNLAAGAGLVVVAFQFGRRYLKGIGVQLAWLATATAPALYWALSSTGADLLFAPLILAYVYVSLTPRDWARPRGSALAGALAGVAFLAKSFALPFFLAHFTLLHAWHWYHARESRPAITRAYLRGLGVFALVAGAWILLLSFKYDRPTVSTSSAYNWSLAGPVQRGEHAFKQGLVAPPYETSESIWEDPSTLPAEGWSPLAEPGYFLDHLRANAAELARILWAIAAYLPVLGLVAMALLAVSLRERYRANRESANGLTAAGLLLLAGYLPVFYEPRYIWPAVVLWLLVMFRMLEAWRARLPRWLFAGLALLLLIPPIVHGVEGIERQGGSGKRYVDAAQTLEGAADLTGRRVASTGEWSKSLIVSHHAGARYFGSIGADRPVNEVISELDRHGIVFVLHWGGETMPAYLNGSKLVGRAPGQLTLYQRSSK